MAATDRDTLVVALAQLGFSSSEVARLVGQQYPPELRVRRIRQIAAEHGAAFLAPQERNKVTDAYLDMVVAFCYKYSSKNYGLTTLLPDVNDLMPPGCKCSRRQLLQAMLRFDPDAYRKRERQAWRKLMRRQVHAPYFGYRWELDYNLKLAYVGLAIGGLWDTCTRYWLRLVVLDNKQARH